MKRLPDRLRVASFNANSIKSRLPIILDWMGEQGCDVLCVQETKTSDDTFPLGPIQEAGYHCVFHGQKAYNGVAIISRLEPADVKVGLGVPVLDEEARLIEADIGGVRVVNTYIPQGTAVGSARYEYKLEWMHVLRERFSGSFAPSEPVLWMGDFNVAMEPIDVYDPEGLRGGVCFSEREQLALGSVMEWGFTDLLRKYHPGEEKLYTFWDYRIPNGFKRKLGWRIDYICATQPLVEKSVDCWVDTDPRQREKPSDHTFIAADFAH